MPLPIRRGDSIFNQTILYREFDEDDRGTEELEEVGCYDESSATKDIFIRVFGCFACPTHSLAEEGSPSEGGSNDGSEVGGVDDGDLIAATFHSFEQEHIVAGRDFRMEIGFAGQPCLAADDEVRAGTHDGMPAFGGPHRQFLNGGVFGYL